MYVGNHNGSNNTDMDTVGVFKRKGPCLTFVQGQCSGKVGDYKITLNQLINITSHTLCK